MLTPGRGERRGVCVLTFHRVVDVSERDHDVTWASFRRLIDALQRERRKLSGRLDSQEPLADGCAALTFDDGTEDHLRAGEHLAERGMTAVFFVPAGRVDTPGYLTAGQVRALHGLGHVIGAHSFSHLRLHRGLRPEEMRREFGECRTFLEETVGGEVTYFAPPGGLGWRGLGRELERYGYAASRSMVWGIYQSLSERWRIPCVPVTEFTLARGWVRRALGAHALPLAMRAAWVMKSAAPLVARPAIRRIFHQPFRTAS